MRAPHYLLAGLLTIVSGCDSSPAVDVPYSDGEPPIVADPPSIAISAYDERDGSIRLFVREANQASFVEKDIPNQHVVVNFDPQWSAAGDGLFFHIGRTDTVEPQELAFMDLEDNSVSLLREGFDINGRFLLAPYSIRPNRAKPSLVAATIERRLQGGSSYYTFTIDADTGVKKEWNPRDYTRPAGWIGADTLVVLSLDSQEVLLMDSEMQLLETIQVPSAAFSDRLGDQWLFRFGDVSRNGRWLAVQVFGVTNQWSAYERQIAVIDLNDPSSIKWVSTSLESGDSFPTWGPDNSIYYINSVLGDRGNTKLAHVRRHFLDSGLDEHVVHPLDIGVSSIVMVDVHWE